MLLGVRGVCIGKQGGTRIKEQPLSVHHAARARAEKDEDGAMFGRRGVWCEAWAGVEVRIWLGGNAVGLAPHEVSMGGRNCGYSARFRCTGFWCMRCAAYRGLRGKPLSERAPACHACRAGRPAWSESAPQSEAGPA